MKHTTFKRTMLMLVLLVMTLSAVTGGTIAWFTDSVESTGNQIKAGNLDVQLLYKNKLGDQWTEVTDESAAIFYYNKWEPGYIEYKYFQVKNNGNLALKFDLHIQAEVDETKEYHLADVIDVYMLPVTANEVTRADIAAATSRGTITDMMAETDGAAHGNLKEGEDATFCIALKMQESAGNEYQHLSIGDGFTITLRATQDTVEKDSFDEKYDADAEYPSMLDVDTWDGTADTTWYNDTATEFEITTAEQLAGLAKLVDDGNTFEDKTIKLGMDLDLYFINDEPVCFEPIGSYRNDQAFKGTFDGQNHTIKNMSQNTWALNNGYYYGDLGLGLFGMVEDATVKNLVMDNASISGESAICGTVAATAYGDCVFENITVTNSEVADYQYYAGGIVGWASGNHQYINCDVDASTTIAAQWGDFDNSVGGVIGGAGGSAEILLKDCEVACRIDAYNDVTSTYQWYAYRRCGMLIGNTSKTVDVDGTTYAAAPQLTCENVTVTYGDWANYTYCEFAGKSWPYVRVQAGVSNSAYSNPRYGHPTDANGNEVVDDNHVHNDGEDHFIECTFDQLYGGGQGVYGDPTHDGVTVIYNNK